MTVSGVWHGAAERAQATEYSIQNTEYTTPWTLLDNISAARREIKVSALVVLLADGLCV